MKKGLKICFWFVLIMVLLLMLVIVIFLFGCGVDGLDLIVILCDDEFGKWLIKWICEEFWLGVYLIV